MLRQIAVRSHHVVRSVIFLLCDEIEPWMASPRVASNTDRVQYSILHSIQLDLTGASLHSLRCSVATCHLHQDLDPNRTHQNRLRSGCGDRGLKNNREEHSSSSSNSTLRLPRHNRCCEILHQTCSMENVACSQLAASNRSRHKVRCFEQITSHVSMHPPSLRLLALFTAKRVT